MYKYIIAILFLLIISCGEAPIPKPKAFLSLNYPEKKYKKINEPVPYTFEVLKSTKVKVYQKSG